MVMLVGVQSNQMPRALDIARPLRARGIAVAVGGFHVSGVLSMLDGVDADLDRARAMGVSLFAGEAEGRFEQVLCDAYAGTLKPLYNFINDLPSLQGAPIPLMAAQRAQRTIERVTSFDAGRGCPYQCSFCTIINVQGRTSRHRTPDEIEKIVRVNHAQGLRAFFITDDNFARNRNWEPILDRLIRLREVEKLNLFFIIQVDTLCHKLPNFIRKCARAGVRRVFIGLENINPANLAGAKKRQNKITEYRTMLLAWKSARVVTFGGYIIGFPNDTFDSVMHDIDVIKRELPIDLLEFFQLTPLPGSEDHLKLVRAGAVLDPDMNNYDLNHVCAAHPLMSHEECNRAYQMAWKRYYTFEHCETIMRRVASTRTVAIQALLMLAWFKGSIDFEGIHPLETGFLRRRHRRDRRPGMPVEPAWRFYPKYWSGTAIKLFQWAGLFLRLGRSYRAIRRDPNRNRYTDLATTPVRAQETETHELFQTGAAKAFVEREQRLRNVRDGASVVMPG
jgi:hypothetical protein